MHDETSINNAMSNKMSHPHVYHAETPEDIERAICFIVCDLELQLRFDMFFPIILYCGTSSLEVIRTLLYGTKFRLRKLGIILSEFVFRNSVPLLRGDIPKQEHPELALS